LNNRAAGNGANADADARDRRERADGLLTTGDMARLTGNTLRTVRFYEEAGILRPDRRSAGGHRLFSQRELERLQFITDMRAAGLSLDEIRALLELKVRAQTGEQAAAAALEALDVQVAALEAKIEVFSRLRRELDQARQILHSCRDCKDDRLFPDACNECGVMTGRADLPQSMRVLWAVDND
jgi:DNA-binding transcriptional MerR regulator